MTSWVDHKEAPDLVSYIIYIPTLRRVVATCNNYTKLCVCESQVFSWFCAHMCECDDDGAECTNKHHSDYISVIYVCEQNLRTFGKSASLHYCLITL